MSSVQVIYRNDGQGNIQILPYTITDMPADHAHYTAWDEFYRQATRDYGLPTDRQAGAFIGRSKAHLYRSTDNLWAVFGFDVRPGIDDHTILLVRFAYVDAQGDVHKATEHPPMSMTPDTARACVQGWERLDKIPAF